MKWGQRRYQNPDGTWTEEGKARRRAQYEKSKGSGRGKVAKVINGGGKSSSQSKAAAPKVVAQKQQPPVQEQKPQQSKKDDYIKDMIKEEERTAEDLRRERQEALELAAYRAQLAEFNKRTVEANTRIKELTTPATVQNTFEKYFAPVLSRGLDNAINNTTKALGDAMVKKLTQKPDGPKNNVKTVTEYGPDGKMTKKTITSSNYDEEKKKGD